MMLIAAVLGVGSGLSGLYLSYYFPVPSGAAIVLVVTACFGVAWLAGRVVAPRAA
jgi:manganese/iron transport system permease protein